MRGLRALGIGLAAVTGAVAAFYLVALRTKSPALLGVVRRVNRAVFNPTQMRTAGTSGAAASVVHHRGRTTGRHYQTPVGVTPTGDGFVIALPYSTQADWLRNVLAHGEATIEHEGRRHRVVAPEVVPVDDAADAFSAAERRVFRVFGVTECLRLREADPAGEPG